MLTVSVQRLSDNERIYPKAHHIILAAHGCLLVVVVSRLCFSHCSLTCSIVIVVLIITVLSLVLITVVIVFLMVSLSLVVNYKCLMSCFLCLEKEKKINSERKKEKLRNNEI